MLFFQRSSGAPRRLAIFPGTFNPVTIAHLALARAALAFADEVVFVLPRNLPHKEYTGATFDQRVQMLLLAAGTEPRFSVAASEDGLFIDIARECRGYYGPGVELHFLCGRDAAERIASWDYGRENAFVEMLVEFGLLVAAREGVFQPDPAWTHAVRTIGIDEGEGVSASEVRGRIARGEAWEHLVPEPVREIAAAIYASTGTPEPEGT